jgi:hypothetical protein
VQEADSAELGVRWRAGTGATECGTDRAQQDLEDGPCDFRVVMQERTEALRDREDPLTGGEVGQHMVGQTGGELGPGSPRNVCCVGWGHAAGVAGGADAPTLAGEGDQALMAAGVTAGGTTRSVVANPWARNVSR